MGKQIGDILKSPIFIKENQNQMEAYRLHCHLALARKFRMARRAFCENNNSLFFNQKLAIFLQRLPVRRQQ